MSTNSNNRKTFHPLSPIHRPSANHSQSPIRLFLEKIRNVKSKIGEIQDRITEIQKKISFSSPSHLNINDVSEKIEVLYNNAKEILGRGANGEVKEVNINGKPYAVKKFSNNISFLNSNVTMSKNQLKNNEWIRSKNIPYLLHMYDTVSKKNGYSYSIMESLNKDEWKILDEIENLTEDKTDKICSKLKEAIQVVHKEDFCLLDINPKNIMIKYKTLNEPNIELKFIDYGSSIYEFQQINEMTGYSLAYKLPDYRNSYEDIEKNKQYAKYRDLFAIHIVCIFLKNHDNFFLPLYTFLEKKIKPPFFMIVIIYGNLLYLLNEYTTETIQNLDTFTLRTRLITVNDTEQIKEIKKLLKIIFPSFYQEFKNSVFTKDPFKSLFEDWGSNQL